MTHGEMKLLYIMHGMGVEGHHAAACLLSSDAHVIGVDVSQNPSIDAEITDNPNFSYVPEAELTGNQTLLRKILNTAPPLSPPRYLRAPGISPANRLYQQMCAAGQRPTTPTGLWLSQQKDRQIITITGTKGKSTTASLTADLISWCGYKARLFGNIGTPPFGVALARETVAIIELSSYMLHDLPPCRHCHVITNLFKEHTDWHGSYEAYKEAKLKPLRRGMPSLISANVDTQRGNILPTSARSIIEEVLPQSDEALLIGGTAVYPGRYNPIFAAPAALFALRTAIAVCRHFLEISNDMLIRALETHLPAWQGLESRQEIIPTSDGVLWVNDALATVPEATLAALHRWADRHIHLILGGKNRGQDLGTLLSYCAGNTPRINLYSFGPIADAMHVDPPPIPCHVAASLEAAVTRARQHAHKGDIILFSPAAPSAPPHSSYKQRADVFRRLALSL